MVRHSWPSRWLAWGIRGNKTTTRMAAQLKYLLGYSLTLSFLILGRTKQPICYSCYSFTGCSRSTYWRVQLNFAVWCCWLQLEPGAGGSASEADDDAGISAIKPLIQVCYIFHVITGWGVRIEAEGLKFLPLIGNSLVYQANIESQLGLI